MKVSKMEDGNPEVYSAIQGEGPSIQEPCVFVRLALCNLQCNFCDTAYTWNFEEGLNVKTKYFKPVKKKEVLMQMSPEDLEIIIRQKAGKIRRVVFTGGEPLLQQTEIYKVIELLHKDGEDWIIEVETNGTLFISEAAMIDQINCSPKLASSGNSSIRHNIPAIQSYIDYRDGLEIGLCFKFVVGKDNFKQDMKEIREWEKQTGCPRELIYLMPEGVDAETIIEGTKMLIDVSKKYGYKLSTRLHVLLYGNKKFV